MRWFRIPFLVLGLGLGLVFPQLRAQSTEPPERVALQALITPGSNTVFITETTNSIFVQLNNFTELTNVFTNFMVFGYVPTNGYGTNILGTNGLSTNIVGGLYRFRFFDDARPPDTAREDGTFSAPLLMPLVLNWGTNLNLRVVVSAEDMFPTDQIPGETNAPIVSITNFMAYTVVARPGNDRFTNAFKIADPTGGVAVGTNSYASMETGEPQHAKVPSIASSVWWTWSAGFTTNAFVDVAGSSFRPVVAVYTGNTLNRLTQIGVSTNDTVNRLAANVTFDAVMGTTYRIAISGFDTNGAGDIRLRIATGTTPDTRPPSVVITSPNREVLTSFDQIVLSGTAREPTPNDSGISNILLQVNSGPLTNAGGTTSWSGRVTMSPGTNVVRAFAMDYAGNLSVPDAIVVRYIDPTNDFFANATRLSGVGGTMVASNRFAGREIDEPLHAGNEGGHSVWYSFRSSISGTLFLTTVNSSLDTLLSVYVGDSLTNLQSLASNDDAFPDSKYSELTFGVLSNQLYYIAVDGYGGAVGRVALDYSFIAPQPGQFYTIEALSGPGGTVSPPSGLFPGGSQVTLTATPDPDYEFAGWSGTSTSQANPLILPVNQNMALRASFRVATTNYVEDFETGNLRRLPWINASAAAWQVQTNVARGGKFAARSGAIGNQQVSSLLLVTKTLKGTASFDLRVSSEPDWDYLEFYLNGSLLERWSGEVNWTGYPFQVPAGTNRFEWKYVKDTSFSEGLDAAFIDNMYYPVPAVDTNAVAAILSLNWLPNRSALITIEGEIRRRYTLESSTDLVVWIPMLTTNSETGVIQFTDRNAVRFPTRYYRCTAPIPQ